MAHLRNGDTYTRLVAGFGIGLATVYRDVREAVAVLTTLGRSLTAALWELAWTHSNFALLDGTLVRTHRIRAHARYYYLGCEDLSAPPRAGSDPYSGWPSVPCA